MLMDSLVLKIYGMTLLMAGIIGMTILEMIVMVMVLVMSLIMFILMKEICPHSWNPIDGSIVHLLVPL